jgi:hypothetical protein
VGVAKKGRVSRVPGKNGKTGKKGKKNGKTEKKEKTSFHAPVTTFIIFLLSSELCPSFSGEFSFDGSFLVE